MNCRVRAPKSGRAGWPAETGTETAANEARAAATRARALMPASGRMTILVRFRVCKQIPRMRSGWPPVRDAHRKSLHRRHHELGVAHVVGPARGDRLEPVSYTHLFGGWKRSIFGPLHVHGPDGVRFYTRLKTITARWPDDVRRAEFVMPTMK